MACTMRGERLQSCCSCPINDRPGASREGGVDVAGRYPTNKREYGDDVDDLVCAHVFVVWCFYAVGIDVSSLQEWMPTKIRVSGDSVWRTGEAGTSMTKMFWS